MLTFADLQVGSRLLAMLRGSPASKRLTVGHLGQLACGAIRALGREQHWQPSPHNWMNWGPLHLGCSALHVQTILAGRTAILHFPACPLVECKTLPAGICNKTPGSLPTFGRCVNMMQGVSQCTLGGPLQTHQLACTAELAEHSLSHACSNCILKRMHVSWHHGFQLCTAAAIGAESVISCGYLRPQYLARHAYSS